MPKPVSKLISESVDESTPVSQSTFEHKFEPIGKLNLKLERQEGATKETINTLFPKKQSMGET